MSRRNKKHDVPVSIDHKSREAMQDRLDTLGDTNAERVRALAGVDGVPSDVSALLRAVADDMDGAQ